MTKRIRIFFLNCPTLATEAAAFLILAQNKFQSVLQFELHHFWLYSLKDPSIPTNVLQKWIAENDDGLKRFLPWIGSLVARRNRANLDLVAAPHFKKPLNFETWLSHTQNIIANYDLWVSARDGNHYDSVPAPTIVITETPLINNFISFTENNLGVVSVARWNVFFKPASALEFVLTGVQRLALRLSCNPMIGSHYPTRGCLWDYTINVPDTKMSSFLGFLCETCQTHLKTAVSQTEFDEIVRLIGNEWIGDRNDLNSIARTLSRNYKYDLSRATGLRPSVKDAIAHSMRSEFGRVFWDIGKWLVLIFLAALIIHFFPWSEKVFRK